MHWKYFWTIALLVMVLDACGSSESSTESAISKRHIYPNPIFTRVFNSDAPLIEKFFGPNDYYDSESLELERLKHLYCKKHGHQHGSIGITSDLTHGTEISIGTDDTGSHLLSTSAEIVNRLPQYEDKEELNKTNDSVFVLPNEEKLQNFNNKPTSGVYIGQADFDVVSHAAVVQTQVSDQIDADFEGRFGSAGKPGQGKQGVYAPSYGRYPMPHAEYGIPQIYIPPPFITHEVIEQAPVVVEEHVQLIPETVGAVVSDLGLPQITDTQETIFTSLPHTNPYKAWIPVELGQDKYIQQALEQIPKKLPHYQHPSLVGNQETIFTSLPHQQISYKTEIPAKVSQEHYYQQAIDEISKILPHYNQQIYPVKGNVPVAVNPSYIQQALNAIPKLLPQQSYHVKEQGFNNLPNLDHKFLRPYEPAFTTPKVLTTPTTVHNQQIYPAKNNVPVRFDNSVNVDQNIFKPYELASTTPKVLTTPATVHTQQIYPVKNDVPVRSDNLPNFGQHIFKPYEPASTTPKAITTKAAIYNQQKYNVPVTTNPKFIQQALDAIPKLLPQLQSNQHGSDVKKQEFNPYEPASTTPKTITTTTTTKQEYNNFDNKYFKPYEPAPTTPKTITTQTAIPTTTSAPVSAVPIAQYVDQALAEIPKHLPTTKQPIIPTPIPVYPVPQYVDQALAEIPKRLPTVYPNPKTDTKLDKFVNGHAKFFNFTAYKETTSAPTTVNVNTESINTSEYKEHSFNQLPHYEKKDIFSTGPYIDTRYADFDTKANSVSTANTGSTSSTTNKPPVENRFKTVSVQVVNPSTNLNINYKGPRVPGYETHKKIADFITKNNNHKPDEHKTEYFNAFKDANEINKNLIMDKVLPAVQNQRDTLYEAYQKALNINKDVIVNRVLPNITEPTPSAPTSTTTIKPLILFKSLPDFKGNYYNSQPLGVDGKTDETAQPREYELEKTPNRKVILRIRPKYPPPSIPEPFKRHAKRFVEINADLPNEDPYDSFLDYEDTSFLHNIDDDDYTSDESNTLDSMLWSTLVAKFPELLREPGVSEDAYKYDVSRFLKKRSADKSKDRKKRQIHIPPGPFNQVIYFPETGQFIRIVKPIRPDFTNVGQLPLEPHPIFDEKRVPYTDSYGRPLVRT